MGEATVELFAGPGGWGEGARLAGLDLDPEGIELDAGACATARAAGHRRVMRDVRRVQVAEYAHVTGLIASPPCPTFSPGGLRTGLGDDYQRVLDVWTSIGWGISPAKAMTCVDDVTDPRTALLALTGVWALTLPNLRWIAFEQVPAVAEAWNDLVPELTEAGWDRADVYLADAADFGAPARRDRSFLVAQRIHLGSHGDPSAGRTPGRVGLPPSLGVGVPRSMATALGWTSGHRVVTRGQRTTSGGNTFSADGASWCLTSSSRSWTRDDGVMLSTAEAGLLNGFRADYPWQGSRSAQFRQAADVVNPIMGAVMLGAATGQDVTGPVARYLEQLYGAASPGPLDGAFRPSLLGPHSLAALGGHTQNELEL